MRDRLTTDIRDRVGSLFSEGKSLEEISLISSIPVGKGNELSWRDFLWFQ
jgi:hypothetical protein